MNINVPNGNVTDLEVVTISCISRDESQVFDEVDSDSDDSSQTDYVSSMYVEYNTSLLDEMSFSDEAVERELPRQCDGKKYVATSTCTAVQSNHEQADNGISLSVVDVNEEVMQERDSEQSVSREVMELIDNAEYKIVDSAMLNVDVTAEGDMPTCSLEKTLENNSFPEMDIQVKPPNTIEKGDAFSLSSDNPQYIQRELSSAEFNSESDARSQLTEENIHPANDKNLDANTKDNQKYINTLFSCSLCNEVFFTKVGCKVHMRKHDLREECKCDICGKVFDKVGLVAHLKSHVLHGTTKKRDEVQKKSELRVETTHNNKSYTCELCGFKGENKGGFITHVKTHQATKETGPYKCSHCSKSYTLKCNLRRHLKEVLYEKRHQCFLCGKRFHQEHDLRRHIKSHSNDVHVNIKCGKCGARFTRRYNYEVHLTKHSGQEPFRCDKCNRAFTIKAHLVQHLNLHSIHGTVKCVDCGELFLTKRQLCRHRYSKHNERGETKCKRKRAVPVGPGKCKDCGEIFPTKGHLYRHRSSKHLHYNSDTMCKICGKMFRTIDNLRMHVRTHTLPLAFKCTVCRMAFTREKYLERHLAVHSSTKPFKCTVCNKRFSNNNDLRGHERSHRGEKPFKCEECGKRFTSKSAVVSHIQGHTEERAFKCAHCTYSCKQSCHLSKHVKTHSLI